jgi:uncharacterized protein with HEPN domain
MSRDESLYLADIQESCEKVIRYTKGMTYKKFVNDDLHFDAVLRNLEIIGEAVKTFQKKQGKNIHRSSGEKLLGFAMLLRMDILELTMKQYGIL